jgi:hypothetical protein
MIRAITIAGLLLASTINGDDTAAVLANSRVCG